MNSVLEGTEHLERELTPEPIAGPAMGSFVLHGMLLAALVFYGVVSGLFHHNLWGGEGAGSAIQVTLSTAIPLPNNQPQNNNVLATEKPSEAPAAPSPKEQHKEDLTAIPIPGKQVKPKEKNTPKTPRSQPQPVQDNVARYGEQNGTSIPRATQQVYTSGQTSVNDASFGSLFGWYVQQIDRTMDAHSYRQLANPSTPKGAKASIEFKISRDGSHNDVRLDQSSGSSSWDSVCLRAAQRVDTFGQLPPGYRGSYLQVFYDCTY
jgi:protein TonB